MSPDKPKQSYESLVAERDRLQALKLRIANLVLPGLPRFHSDDAVFDAVMEIAKRLAAPTERSERG